MGRATVLGAAVLGAACATGGGPTTPPASGEATSPAPTLVELLGSARVVDLTQPIAPGIPVYPGGTGFQSTNVGTIAESGYYINEFRMGEHTGTHVDAPNHFAEGGVGVDAIAPGSLLGPAAVIDISAKVQQDPDATLSVADLEAWEQQHGALTPGTIVLVHTGWAARWPDVEQYRNPDAKDVMHFPGLSVEASTRLAERGIAGVGIDTLSTDPGSSATFDQHRQFLGAGGFHIENVTNLDQLPPTGAVVIVAPLPLVDGSGAPARILALVPEP